jgi:endonuclease-3
MSYTLSDNYIIKKIEKCSPKWYSVYHVHVSLSAGTNILMKDKIDAVYRILDSTYPDTQCALTFTNPLELLVASILSAQCTDERVNEVTARLFKKYKTAADYAAAETSVLEEEIHSTGFFRNKAKAIRECTAMIDTRHGGVVPDTMKELAALPGIGRKTANLVLACGFGQAGIIVDTHVFRLARRIGFTENNNSEKIEFDLRAIIPEDRWSRFSLLLISHGRTICKAKKPLCPVCSVRHQCDYFANNPAAS